MLWQQERTRQPEPVPIKLCLKAIAPVASLLCSREKEMKAMRLIVIATLLTMSAALFFRSQTTHPGLGDSVVYSSR